MDAVYYWEMTYAEITATINAYQKRKRTDMQVQAIVAYKQAETTAALVSRIFGGNNKVPTVYEMFPDLFPEQSKPKQQNWQLMKARVEAYAAEKRKRGEMKHGNDT